MDNLKVISNIKCEETFKEIIQYLGHSRGFFAVSFHLDGVIKYHKLNLSDEQLVYGCELLKQRTFEDTE